MTNDSPPPVTPFFTPRRIACVLILVVAALACLPALRGVLLAWDDQALVSGKAFGGGRSLLDCFTHPFLDTYFRPLTALSFFFENRFAARNAHHVPNPFFYHLVNILLHVATTGLVIGLLRECFPERPVVSLLGGLLFATQPAQIPATAWIGGRTDGLCALFVAAAGWATVRAARSEGRSRDGFAGFGAFLWLCAVLSKEQALALLPIGPLAFVCFAPTSRGSSTPDSEKRRAWLRPSIPFLVATVFYLALWKICLPNPFPRSGDPTPLSVVGQTLLYYALLLFVPSPRFVFAYSLSGFETRGPIWSFLGFGVAVGVVVGFLRALRSAPRIAWLLALTFIPILPVCNLIALPSILVVAPYRVGVCGVGAAALTALVLVAVGERAKTMRWALYGTPVVCCFALSFWSAAQWTNKERLFRAFLQNDPGSMIINGGMADILLPREPEAAAVLMENLLNRLYGSSNWRDPRAAAGLLKTDPRILVRVRENKGTDAYSRQTLSVLFAKLGMAYLRINQDAGATAAFQASLNIPPTPEPALYGLGALAFRRGDYAEAIRLLEQARAADSKDANALYLLAQSYARQNRWSEARDLCAEVLRLRPNFEAARRLLQEAERKTIAPDLTPRLFD